MSPNAVPPLAGTCERENELKQEASKMAKPASARRALQDVSNAPRKLVEMSPNAGKRPRSQSMEVVREVSVEKKSRPSGCKETKIEVQSARQENAVDRMPDSPSFVVRIALDHSIEPEPLYSQEEYDDDLDPQMCEEYAPLIYTFMYDLQEKYMVNPGYIDEMPAGHRWYRNRSTLLNWLLTVHRKFRLAAETLYLATNIIDRFLSKKTIGLDQVQLLAASALFVASKYEEVMTPAIGNFAFVANATVDDIRSMEQRVLVAIEFDLGYPCPLNFLRRISRADDYDMRTRTIAKFMLEMVIFEPKLMVFRPSDVAAASMFLARKILGIEGWSANFIYYSGGCTEDGLAPIVEVMTEYLQDSCEKRDPEFVQHYMSKKVLRAAVLAINWARGESEQPPTTAPPTAQSDNSETKGG